MKTAKLSEVKDRLSYFVEQVGRGHRVRILVRGTPVADLVPCEHGGVEHEGWSNEELSELERAGLIRRPPARRKADALLDRPGPKVRGDRAVDALIAERARR
jgi:prevent-host-death family protein